MGGDVAKGAEVDVDQLLAELGAARAEIERLRQELARLRPTVRSDQSPHTSELAPRLFSATTGPVDRVDGSSPPDAKVRLFRRLFAGRDDVYAQRWESSSSGKAGWSPATSGPSRIEGGRQYARLDDEVIAAHLSGRLAAGVYPLIDGDRCWFLACDFDKGSWLLDALAYLDVCQSAGVAACLERSRSGNGGHVWTFFDEPVDAAAARRLGMGLLRETMALRAEVDLASYDRLFPSQDFVPERGFGNLIALPLQGRARKQGNTVFLDPVTHEPWPDQWAFLSSVRRLPVAEVKSIGDSLRVDAGPGSAGPVSSLRRSRPVPPVPPVVRARLGATLEIDRIGLPPTLVAAIKHLASIHNPEFHQRQQLRLSTWNTPRMVRCYEEELDRLLVPRGCLDDVEAVLRAAGSRLEVHDDRPDPALHEYSFTGVLSGAQEAAVRDLVAHELGVLVAPTGAGKTVIACALIARIGTPTLVLVHTRTLAEQWRQRLAEFLGLPSRSIGQLGAGRRRRSGVVDIVTLPTLARRPAEAAAVFDGYGLVIVDECHHLPAATFEQCVKSAPNRRWVGLTATPQRRDGLEGILHMQLGPVRHKMRDDVATVMSRRDVLVHETLSDPDTEEGAPVQAVLGALTADAERNKLICADVAEAHHRGRNCLVLTDRTHHLEALRAGLEALGLQPAVLKGGTTKSTHQVTVEALRVSTDPVVLLATGAYLGEGFDLPRLDTLFLASPISGRSRVVQYAGRVTRPLPGKTAVEVHDYHDALHPLLRRMHKRRLAALTSIGFQPMNR